MGEVGKERGPGVVVALVLKTVRHSVPAHAAQMVLIWPIWASVSLPVKQRHEAPFSPYPLEVKENKICEPSAGRWSGGCLPLEHLGRLPEGGDPGEVKTTAKQLEETALPELFEFCPTVFLSPRPTPHSRHTVLLQ